MATDKFAGHRSRALAVRHRDARTTLQKYGHAVGDSQGRAVESLAAKIERHAVIDLMPSAELMPTAI
jgi:hypothetical protein